MSERFQGREDKTTRQNQSPNAKYVLSLPATAGEKQFSESSLKCILYRAFKDENLYPAWQCMRK